MKKKLFGVLVKMEDVVVVKEYKSLKKVDEVFWME